MADKVESGSVAPPESEPFELPGEYDEEFALDPAVDIAFENALKARRKKADVVVVSNGTNAPKFKLGRPVIMEPTSQMAIFNNLLCREELDPSGPLPPPSPTIVGLQNVMTAIAKGDDLNPYKENIDRVVSNQPEKGELIGSYLNQANKEALVKMVVMRDHSLNVIVQAATRNDLHLSEALVVWSKCNEQIPIMTKGIGTEEKPVDSAHVVEKIDYNKQKVERDVRHRWDGTTPQGRELIRKKLWEVKREMLAKEGIHPTGVTAPAAAEPPEDENEADETPTPPPQVTLAHPP